jgi:Ca2+-transporting ATPase
VALVPLMVIFLNFFVAVFPVAAIITDVTDPTVMDDKPRDPTVQIFNRSTGPRWILYGLVLGAMSLLPLVAGPDEPKFDGPSISMTMAFGVMGLSTVISGFAMRHERRSAFAQPLLKYAGILGMGALVVVLATQFAFLQRWLDTVPLTANQWAAVLGLSLVMPVVVELDKAWQRHRA